MIAFLSDEPMKRSMNVSRRDSTNRRLAHSRTASGWLGPNSVIAMIFSLTDLGFSLVQCAGLRETPVRQEYTKDRLEAVCAYYLYRAVAYEGGCYGHPPNRA